MTYPCLWVYGALTGMSVTDALPSDGDVLDGVKVLKYQDTKPETLLQITRYQITAVFISDHTHQRKGCVQTNKHQSFR